MGRQGLEDGAAGANVSCQPGVELPFGKAKKFWRRTALTVARSVTGLNATEPSAYGG